MNRKALLKGCRTPVLLAALALCAEGCGPPQAAPQNRQLIASLRTALSAQNPDWLEQNAKILEQRRAAGEVSEEAFTMFQAVIERARSGQWKEAESQAIAFQKGQRPTREEVRQYRQPGG